MEQQASSAYQSAVVHVRGHDFTVDYQPNSGALPTVLRLGLAEYPDDVLRIIDPEVLVLIRMEAQKRSAENEMYIARKIEMERSEP